jgi:hypothetical protein
VVDNPEARVDHVGHSSQQGWPGFKPFSDLEGELKPGLLVAEQ